MLTWISAAVAVMGSSFVAVPIVVIFFSFDMAGGGSEGDSWWWLVGPFLAVWALAAAGAVAARAVVRAKPWARWLLVAVSCVQVGAGVMTSPMGFPAAVALCALAVLVLLCHADSRAWFRDGATPVRSVRAPVY